MNESKATVHYSGDEFFIGISPGGHAQVLDTNHDRGSAATPVELLLIALGSCTAVDVVSILAKKRMTITDYRVEVKGTRSEEHPRKFIKMEVRHIIRGDNLTSKAIEQAIELSESKYCSVAATIRPTVEILSSYEIIDGA